MEANRQVTNAGAQAIDMRSCSPTVKRISEDAFSVSWPSEYCRDLVKKHMDAVREAIREAEESQPADQGSDWGTIS